MYKYCHALKCALNLTFKTGKQAKTGNIKWKNFPILPDPRAIQKASLKHWRLAWQQCHTWQEQGST